MKKYLSLYNLTLFLFVQYVIVTLLMIMFYDAGNRYTPESTHFVFNQNYLSDLGRSVSFAGVENPSYVFYSFTLGLAGIGIFLFFYQLQNSMTSKAKHLISLFALVSAIGYIGIALYPVNIDLVTHVRFGRLAYFSFFFTAVFSHVLLDRGRFKMANKLFWILNILLFLYLLLMLFGPSSSQGVWALQLKTIAQKVVVYSQTIFCLGIFLNISKKPKKS
jgi:hypothetical membrane protein